MSSRTPRRSTMPQVSLGRRGAALLLATLRGELSPEQAAMCITSIKKAPQARPCAPGAYGVCATHGQLHIECQQAKRER